jgi:DNA-binding MarR family transcriptional regulator
LDGKMLKIIKSIEESSKIRILTIEFEIICAVIEQNGQSAGEIFSKVRSSSASFYYALRFLSDSNLLVKISDPFDRRISRYSVNKEFQDRIFTAFTEIQNLNRSDS